MDTEAALSKVRIYASAQNLFTIKNNFYEGFDPENSIGSGASCYPLNKTFIFRTQCGILIDEKDEKDNLI